MNVLITGVASGIGLAVSNIFLNSGHAVYGIDINEVAEKENLYTFKGDITSIDSMEEIKDYFIRNGINFNMIINVAGIHKMAALVETDFSTLKKVMDINLCGTMLVNRTFHSLLNNDGRIVIITSEVASFDPLPFNGLYSISKSALETYAQALRQELNLLGQKVITIQPGAIETPLSGGSLNDTEKLANETILYQNQAHHFLNLTKKFMGTPITTTKLANFIYKKTTKKRVKYTYKIHRSFGLVLLNILPKRLQCFLIKILLDRKKKVG